MLRFARDERAANVSPLAAAHMQGWGVSGADLRTSGARHVLRVAWGLPPSTCRAYRFGFVGLVLSCAALAACRGRCDRGPCVPAVQARAVLRFDGVYRSDDGGSVRKYLRFYADGTVLAMPSTGVPSRTWFAAETPELSTGTFRRTDDRIWFTSRSPSGQVEYDGFVTPDGLQLEITSRINGHRSVSSLRFLGWDEVEQLRTDSAREDTEDLDSVITGSDLLVAPSWRVVFYASDVRSVGRYSLTESQARSAGLSAEEAAFQGDWSYLWRGIAIGADRTFRFWSAIPNQETLSAGNWSVQRGRLRLEHTSIRGVAQDPAHVTEHELADLEGPAFGELLEGPPNDDDTPAADGGKD